MRQEMRDVVDEILDLPLRERARRPIADRLRLRQSHAADAAHQIGQRHLHSVAEKRGGDLRVEDARRHEVEAIGEDLQVGRERVTDDGRVRERERERAQLGQRERIDDRGAVVERELHDHQPRRVRALGVELGVEAPRGRPSRPARRAVRGSALPATISGAVTAAATPVTGDETGSAGSDAGGSSRVRSGARATRIRGPRTVTRSPKIVSSAQIGTAIAHIVHTCTHTGTRNAAAVAVATVPPNPGMTRTASKNAGEPTGKRFTHAGRRCRYS